MDAKVEKITNYLISEGMQPQVAEYGLEKIQKHVDILADFERFIDTQGYEYNNALRIDNVSAAEIHKMAPFLSPLGVYDFMVTMREKPDLATRYITEGFPQR